MRVELKTARLKITLLYVVIISLFLFITLSISLNVNTQELKRFKQGPNNPKALEMQKRVGAGLEQFQIRFRNRLVIFNIVLLVPSLFIAYYFSGVTLRPIEETLKQKEEFAGDVSHELRTPLQNIRLEIENIIAHKNPVAKDYKKSLKSIEEESIRIESITESLLSMVRLDKTSVQKENIKIKSAVYSAIKLNENLSYAKSIKIIEAFKSNFFVNAERQQLTTAISIVLENSLKYSKNKSQVEITSYIKDTRKILSIKDFGVGIQKENFTKVFESFYREDNKVTRKVQGSGIGLSLVKKIAEKNNFNVEIKSNPGKGTKILFIWS